MSNASKGAFVFLLAFSVVSLAMLFDGVARMKRNGAPPFADGLVTSVDSLPRPPEGIIRQLDQSSWRIGVWIVAAAILMACIYSAFRSQRVLAFAVLLPWATAVGIFALWVWLYSLFHKFKM
jgi:hypothetical protein